MIDPQDFLLFVQTKLFDRAWERLGLSDVDLRWLQLGIITNPKVGAVLKGTGGLRKLRFAPPGAEHGKSGSHRVCYVLFEEFGTVLLVTAYSKNKKDTLTEAEKKAIRQLIEGQHELLKKGPVQ